MIKHPALRVRSSQDIDHDFHVALAKDCFAFISLTPFSNLVLDLQEVGSYARECAELHSDLDINIKFSSEKDRLVARQMGIGKEAVNFLNQLRLKYGILLEFALQDYDAAEYGKSYFSMKEIQYYPGLKNRIYVDYITKEITERVKPRLYAPRLGVPVFDEEEGMKRPFDPSRDTPNMYDTWFNELDIWRQKYGTKFLEFGQTEETNWML